jgi:enoyl-CoA hydratase
MHVFTEQCDGVAVVRLLRPDKRNAINRAMADEIRAALDSAERDPGVRVCVLTGDAETFCAGTDVLAPPDDGDLPGGEYGVVRRTSTKPLIAAVEGIALGGGFEIVLSCDLVVAAQGARFGLPEARLGLIASCGGLFRTPRALPVNVAAELLLTGRQIDADRAYALGLVNVVCADGSALREAIALAQQIMLCAPRPTAHAVAETRRYRRRDDELGWVSTVRAVTDVVASSDAAEGVAAFKEHRAPRWSLPG